MKLSERFEYPASPDQVFALVSDPTFREESCAHQGAVDYDVSVTPEGDTTVIRIKRTMQSEMPDFIQKLTGDTITVLQTEKWGPADASGSRTADIEVDVEGQPARMRGTSTISASGDTTVMTLDGDVKVSLPLIGKRIEPEVAHAISASLREEVEFGTTRL